MGWLSPPHWAGEGIANLGERGQGTTLNRTWTQSGTRFQMAGAGTREQLQSPFLLGSTKGLHSSRPCLDLLGGCKPQSSLVQGVLTHARAQGRHKRGLLLELPPPPSTDKGSAPHLGQGSACYSVPALTQMVQQLCQPPPKTPRTFCTQTAFRRPWQRPGSGGALPSRGRQWPTGQGLGICRANAVLAVQPHSR